MTAPTSKKPSSRKPPPSTAQPFELRPSSIQGQGAFALRPIRKDERIIEYLGERISQDEADERYDDTTMSRHHTFLFNVDDDTVIDAAHEGNDARFINHSCNPNCQALLEKDRIFIYALRDIAEGEELSYDYSYERTEDMGEEEERLYVCHCGAPNCRGTILNPVKPPEVKKKAPARKKSSSKVSKSSRSSKSSKSVSKSGRNSKGRTRAARG